MHDDQTLVGTFPPYEWRKRFKFLPDLFEIWHTDQYDDAGRVVCGFNEYKKLSHITHWRLRFLPLARFKRKLFLRCAYCGGPSRKNNLVNISTSWEQENKKFWWNHPRTYHQRCFWLHNNDKNQIRYAEELSTYNYALIAGFTGSPWITLRTSSPASSGGNE